MGLRSGARGCEALRVHNRAHQYFQCVHKYGSSLKRRWDGNYKLKENEKKITLCFVSHGPFWWKIHEVLFNRSGVSLVDIDDWWFFIFILILYLCLFVYSFLLFSLIWDQLSPYIWNVHNGCFGGVFCCKGVVAIWRMEPPGGMTLK